MTTDYLFYPQHRPIPFLAKCLQNDTNQFKYNNIYLIIATFTIILRRNIVNVRYFIMILGRFQFYISSLPIKGTRCEDIDRYVQQYLFTDRIYTAPLKHITNNLFPVTFNSLHFILQIVSQFQIPKVKFLQQILHGNKCL